jgi:hypothetical protein
LAGHVGRFERDAERKIAKFINYASASRAAIVWGCPVVVVARHCDQRIEVEVRPVKQLGKQMQAGWTSDHGLQGSGRAPLKESVQPTILHQQHQGFSA